MSFHQEMSFREKSAWAMAAVMIVTGLVYARSAMQAPAGPVLGPLLPYVMAVVALSVLVQAMLGIASPREANAPADERERLALAVAGQWSGHALAALVVLAGGAYVLHGQGALLFHCLVLALIVAQLAEYGLQGWFLRRGV